MRNFIEVFIIYVIIILIVGVILAFFINERNKVQPSTQTIEQKLDVIIELIKRDRETLRIPEMSGQRDEQEWWYTWNNYQEEVE